MKHFDDIKDDEIRIISQQEVRHKPFYRRWWFWTAIVTILFLVALSILLAFLSSNRHSQQGTIEEVTLGDEPTPTHPYIVETEPAEVIVRDTTVNDVPLRLYMPVNALPELQLGTPDTADESIILALQAADVRADNQEIVGAFVRKGELLSRGSAKKGFCAIIDWSIHIGMAESTPLFEEAIAKEGYFFRQYPLVSERKMVENKPKNKAMRRALCEMDGKILVVNSMDRESFHDFAQALADLGVRNAIYLTGAAAYGFCRSNDESSGKSTLTEWNHPSNDKQFRNANFIVWRVPAQ